MDDCNAMSMKQIKSTITYKDIPSKYRKSTMNKPELCTLIRKLTSSIRDGECRNMTLEQIRTTRTYKDLPRKYKKSTLTKSKLCDLIGTVGHGNSSNNHRNVLQRKRRSNIDHIIKRKYGKSALDILPDGYHFMSKIGAGENGDVYLVSKGIYSLVVKIMTENSPLDTMYEVLVSSKFGQYKIGPTIHRYNRVTYKRKTYAFVLMERIDYTLEDYLTTNVPERDIRNIVAGIESRIKSMCSHGLVHGDLHIGNIGLRGRITNGGIIQYEVVFFDNGFSSVTKQNTRCKHMYKAECTQLMRVLSREYSPLITSTNRKHMIRYIYDMVKRLIPASELRGLRKPEDFNHDVFVKWVDPVRPTRRHKHKYVRKFITPEPLQWITFIKDEDDVDDLDYVPDDDSD